MISGDKLYYAEEYEQDEEDPRKVKERRGIFLKKMFSNKLTLSGSLLVNPRTCNLDMQHVQQYYVQPWGGASRLASTQ